MQQVKSKSHIFPNFAGQDVFELENIISVEKCILVTLILLFLGNLTNMKLYYNNLQKCHNILNLDVS